MLIPQLYRMQALYQSYFSVYYPTPLFEWLGLGRLPLEVVMAAGVGLVVMLLLAAFGCMTRVALTVAWILFFVFAGTVVGFEKPVPNSVSPYTLHYNNICLFVLLILSVAPGVSLWGVDGARRRGWVWPSGQASRVSVPSWPILLIKFSLAFTYFGAGYTKLKASGVLWADGYTLQAYLLLKHLQEDLWAGYWLAQSYRACVVLSIATLVLEFGFLVVPFLSNRHPLTWVFVAGGLGFHGIIYLTMGIGHFLPFMGLTYLVFLDWALISRFLPSLPISGATAAFAPNAAIAPALLDRHRVWRDRFAGLFIAIYLGIHLGSIFGGIEAWPFTDYRVFADRSHYTQVSVDRIQGVDQRGNIRWLEPRDLGPGFNGYYDGTDFTRFYAYRVREHTGEQTASEILGDFLEHLPARSGAQLDQLALVRRTIAREPDGRLVPANHILFHVGRSETR